MMLRGGVILESLNVLTNQWLLEPFGARPLPVSACRSSFIVFQPLHSGQRPNHRGDWWPHV
jgi:hypothetical protein